MCLSFTPIHCFFFPGGFETDFGTAMSTGKRLPKRSIIGTRIVAPGDDGRLFPGVIMAVKTSEDPEGTGPSPMAQPPPTEGGPEAKYSVRFDDGRVNEFSNTEIIGPGFSNVTRSKLKPNQVVYVTHANREYQGRVLHHRPNIDQVIIALVSHLFAPCRGRHCPLDH